MTRNEGIGLGLASIGHVVLFALLSLAWLAPKTPPPPAKPIEVSLVDAIALEQHAPAAPEPPSQSAAPDHGPPAEAPPPAKPAEAAPEPAPPKPRPEAVPPPKPSLVPKTSLVPKSSLVPKPSSVPKKPVAEKVDKPDRSKAPPAKAVAPSTKAVAATRGEGMTAKATRPRATGSLLDDDFRKGLSQSPARSKASEAAPGAVMNAQAAANIGSAILRQVQPCANRQSIPGPGASRISVLIRLHLNRDGSMSSPPEIPEEAKGVDDENERYVDAVKRSAIATFTGCSPLRGLPAELYDVPQGWKVFRLRYKMPG